LTFEKRSTTFLRNIKEKTVNVRLLSLSVSDTEVFLFSVRNKTVQPSAANVHLPVESAAGADWQIGLDSDVITGSVTNTFKDPLTKKLPNVILFGLTEEVIEQYNVKMPHSYADNLLCVVPNIAGKFVYCNK
jgi:hypothetical protein